MGLVTTGDGQLFIRTVQLMAEHFRQLNAERESFKACEELAKEQCPAFQMPFEPARGGVLRGRAGVRQGDDEPALQRCLEGLATSFSLPRPQVTLLRQIARLLLTSPEFCGMRMIAVWKPSRRRSTRRSCAKLALVLRSARARETRGPAAGDLSPIVAEGRFISKIWWIGCRDCRSGGRRTQAVHVEAPVAAS